jgi:hypothetical protein
VCGGRVGKVWECGGKVCVGNVWPPGNVCGGNVGNVWGDSECRECGGRVPKVGKVCGGSVGNVRRGDGVGIPPEAPPRCGNG